MIKNISRARRQYEQSYRELRLYGEETYAANNWRRMNDAQECASLTYDLKDELFTGWINDVRKYKFYDLMATRHPMLWFRF